MSRLPLIACLPLFVLAACGLDGADRDTSEQPAAEAPVAAASDDPLASRDPTGNAPLDPAQADDQPRPVMQAQVVLDRLGFTPGVVDGKTGMSTRNALKGFQQANDLDRSGELDEATKRALEQWSNIPATRVVTIPADFAAGPFYETPEEPADQAKMPVLTYESLDEKLAERFHTTVEVLKQLNPGGVPAGMTAPPQGATSTPTPSATSPSAGGGATLMPGPASFFRAGQQVRVPNVGADRIDPSAVDDKSWLATLKMLGVGTQQPKADKIVVDKSAGTLLAYDAGGKIVAAFTATMGSSNDPLPLGDWKILGKALNPPFNYNPDLFWDAKPTDEKAKLPPGPNGPVGVVWIDLSKEHYGIHGTPNPETIGRAESHGCVRLTNWDAARLAQMVSGSTKVSFVA
ncbi:MAG: L,D-transpeptidase family protein [Novosphingobium sp.]|nr:L,D-transpeptidase family protein [Novosphingobium sp.]